MDKMLSLLLIAMLLLTGCVNYKELANQSKILDNGTPAQKRLAVKHLIKIGAPAVPGLSRIIWQRKNQLSVSLAIDALGKIASPKGAPALIGIIENKHIKYFPAVKKAIVMLPASSVIPTLTKKIAKFNDASLIYAIDILGAFKDPTACSSLMPMLKRKNYKVVAAASRALVKLAPDSIPFLTAGLNSHNLAYRRKLEKILIKIGNPACGVMLEKLKSLETRERKSAVRVLGGIHNPETMDDLIDMLSDPMISIRREAAKSVAEYGDKAIPALSLKIKNSSNDSIILKQSAFALGMIDSDKSIAILARMLAGKNVLVKEAAAKAMGFYSSTKAVEILKKALMDSDWRVRKSAAESLKKQKWTPENKSIKAFFMLADQDWAGLIKYGEPSLKALKLALKDPAGWIRRSAIETITAIKMPDEETLIKVTHDESPKIRSASARVLGNIRSTKAEDRLISLIADTDRQVKIAAINSLGKIKSKKAVPDLRKMLKSKDRNIRSEAVTALSLSGDSTVIKDLAQIAEKDHWEVRKKAILGLGRFNTAESGKALVMALDDQDFFNRKLAADILKKRNWKAQNNYEQCLFNIASGKWDDIIGMGADARPVLLVFVDDKNYIVRMLSYEMLAYCGNKNDFPVLVRGLEKDPEPGVCEAAGFAIYRIGGQEATNVLINTYNKSDIPLIRKIACQNLGKFKKLTPETVQVLSNALSDESHKVRMAAATALGRSKETSVVNALIKMVNTDKDALPRRAAARALRRIGNQEAMIFLAKLRHKSKDIDVRREAKRAFRR